MFIDTRSAFLQRRGAIRNQTRAGTQPTIIIQTKSILLKVIWLFIQLVRVKQAKWSRFLRVKATFITICCAAKPKNPWTAYRFWAML